MKISPIIILAFLIVGCVSSRQDALLNAEQAGLVAIKLANDKAATIYHRQPFHGGQPAGFVAGHWIWRQLTTGDFEATVELAADGSTNSVVLNLLTLK